MMHAQRFVGSILALVLTLTTVVAQMPSGKDKVTIAPIVAIEGAAGDTVQVKISMKIAKHWHSYGFTKTVGPDGLGPDYTVLSVAPASVAKLAGKPRVLKGSHKKYDDSWQVTTEELEGTVEVQAAIVLDRALPVGKTALKLTFGMQMCDTTSCLPFEDFDPITVPVTVTDVYKGPADASTAPVTTGTVVDTQRTALAPAVVGDQSIETEKSKGLWSFFLYAMGVGFLALLTPCVFPMIPITVSFFTKRHEKSKGKGLQESLLFGLGIISTFTAVGIIASVIFGGTAVQDLAANPWLNLGIGALFMALAFNLFGAFEIQVPVSIMNALNKKSQGDGKVAILLMGLTFSLTSFTCTVPFVGTLLLSASGGDYLYPAVGTLGFATAFALPFVGLSMFPSLLLRLPRAGGWMNNLKVVMGFLEIAAAIKFFSTAEFIFGLGLLPREVFLAVWAGVCLLIMLYLLGTFKMKLDSPLESVSGVRALFAVIFATLAFWFVGGMLGKPLASDLEALLPPENYHELLLEMNTGVAAPPTSSTSGSAAEGSTIAQAGTSVHDGLTWYSNLDEAKRVAARENKPIFIDFTGFSCVNCRKMEKAVFPQSMVVETFKKFVLVQLYTDRKSEPYISNQNLLKSYGTVANPLYVLLRPDGSYVAQSGYQLAFTSNPQTFVEFLSKAL
jgi:thiol:disulfide interchange protein DsbD